MSYPVMELLSIAMGIMGFALLAVWVGVVLTLVIMGWFTTN